MSSISKTKYGTYMACWREKGTQYHKTFKLRKEAQQFLSMLGMEPEAKTNAIKMDAVFEAYSLEVTPKKKGARNELIRINRWKRNKIARMYLHEVTTKYLQELFDARQLEVSDGTVLREMGTLSGVLNWAVKQGWIPASPLRQVEKPKEPDHRERVASEKEIAKLMKVVEWDGKTPPQGIRQLVVAAFVFSCRTGMRSGEILRIRESWIEDRVIHLPKEKTKTDTHRDVALSGEAYRILQLVREANPETLFNMTDTLRDAIFRQVRDAAGLGPVIDEEGLVIKEGLNFHDGRATFATWAASPDPKTGAPRLDVMTLARQTGHKNLRMLMKYYRPSAHDVAKRLSEM